MLYDAVSAKGIPRCHIRYLIKCIVPRYRDTNVSKVSTAMQNWERKRILLWDRFLGDPPSIPMVWH
jgi:hypothetical protein